MFRETGGPAVTGLGRGPGSPSPAFLTSAAGAAVLGQSLPSDALARAALPPGFSLTLTA